jgi:5-methyltetrahydropteroyltriglutamate--homocysteine methyltransferase
VGTVTSSPHAEHVGSLLRPPLLLDARAARERGEFDDAALAELTDQAILEVLELQRGAGIGVFTDGEYRRSTWMAGLLEDTGGVVPIDQSSDGVQWIRDGETAPEQDTQFDLIAASDTVYRKRTRTLTEAAFMVKHSPGPFKITMMSASMGAMIWRNGISSAAYPHPADLVRDLVALQIEEITQLIDAGARWIQLDSLSYNQVFDPHFRAGLGLGNVPPAVLLDAVVTADQTIVAGAKRRDPSVTVAMHICRGNNRGAWMSSGSYEAVAERLFGETGVDRFLLEYDTGRAGGFEPLRFVGGDSTVVLGIVSSKTPALEDEDDLLRRVDEAAQYVPGENLAISPQCGFASTQQGNLLTIDDERRKLELVARTAQRLWG